MSLRRLTGAALGLAVVVLAALRPDPVLAQAPQPRKEAPDELPTYRVPTTLPSPDELFRLETDAALQERIRREPRPATAEPVTFPEQPTLATTVYAGRSWPPLREVVE